MTKICCVCSKVERNGNWIIECGTQVTEPLTHGYCPACYDDVMKDLGGFVNTTSFKYPRVIQGASKQDRAEVCAF